MTDPARTRPLRRDAAANRERLLAAAVRTGAAQGRAVPMQEIAAAAGVGVGTLYRRYPDRAALLEALAARAYRLLIGFADTALREESTGIRAVQRFLEDSFAVRDELVLPLHGSPVAAGGDADRLRLEVRARLTAVVDRGRADGTLRADVTAGTVVRFGAMLAQPMSGVPGWAEAADEQRRVFLRGIAG